MMVYNGKEREWEWNGEREETKKRKKKNPMRADMMEHSLLCGKEAKVIYTSVLHAEIKENGTEMPV